MRGFKVFNPDWTCNDFQYEVGKTFKHEGEIVLCESGFHFCKNLRDCFSYYRFDPKNKVAEVEAIGNMMTYNGIKYVTDEIKIIRELTWSEVLELCNTGYHNSGYDNAGNYNSGKWNTGDHNTGDMNSGSCNSGDYNTGSDNSGYGNCGYDNAGYRNSGDCNSGDHNVGAFNSGNRNIGYFNNAAPKTIYVFNIEIPFDRRDEIIKNSGFRIFKKYFKLNRWISYDKMSDEEKFNHPYAKIVGGYLKEYTYKEACKHAWNRMSYTSKEELQKLPNFDPDVFYDITGIDVNE